MRERFSWLLWLGLALVPLLAWAGYDLEVDNRRWTDKYDHHFRKHSKHYFGVGFDWRWFKAQAIAESGLRSGAKSARGAVGLMQIMPPTYGDILEQNPTFGDISDPRWNIAAGIYYDRQLYKRWSFTPKNHERMAFTFASYNAGHNRVRKGLRASLEETGNGDWKQVAPYTPAETRRYVSRIFDLMRPGE